jgi:hypothetical protein
MYGYAIHKLSDEKARSRLRLAPAIAAAGGYLEEEEEKGRRRRRRKGGGGGGCLALGFGFKICV